MNLEKLLPAIRGTIRARRMGCNLSTVDAAARAGISQPAWCRLESSKRELSVTLLARAATGLGIKLSTLIREAEAYMH